MYKPKYSDQFKVEYQELKKRLFDRDYEIFKKRLYNNINNILQEGPKNAMLLDVLPDPQKKGKAYGLYQIHLLNNENDRVCLYFYEDREDKTINFFGVGAP